MNAGRVAPDELTEAERYLTSETTRARGSIIGSYAQVEFVLADFAVKCSRRPEFAALVDGFPYKMEARLRAVTTILKREPFRRYRDVAKPLVTGLERWEELRHMMAHGFLMIEVTAEGQHRLVFRMYEPAGDREAILHTFPTNLELLVQASVEAAAYAHSFVTLFRRIYLEQAIEGDV
jgi:hypothetical protein